VPSLRLHHPLLHHVQLHLLLKGLLSGRLDTIQRLAQQWTPRQRTQLTLLGVEQVHQHQRCAGVLFLADQGVGLLSLHPFSHLTRLE
jgi:hypothetical protein